MSSEQQGSTQLRKESVLGGQRATRFWKGKMVLSYGSGGQSASVKIRCPREINEFQRYAKGSSRVKGHGGVKMTRKEKKRKQKLEGVRWGPTRGSVLMAKRCGVIDATAHRSYRNSDLST